VSAGCEEYFPSLIKRNFDRTLASKFNNAERIRASFGLSAEQEPNMAGIAPDMTPNSIHVQPGLEARRWERFSINKPGSLLAINPGLSGMTSRSCQVVDISRGGAGLQVNTTIGLPDHYYLSFLGAEERIGCAEVYRNGLRIGVRFIKPLAEHALSEIIRNDFLTR
jgi:hypothetical protein